MEGAARLTPGGIAARVLVVLACLPLIALWGGLALLLVVFKCDDNCSGNQAENWQYTGQAMLAMPGVTLALLALILSFTRHRSAFRVCACLGLGSVLAWVIWLGQGSF